MTTFKEMNKEEKIEHIWEYYKLHIIAGITGLVIIYSFLNIWVFNPVPDNALDVTVRTEFYDYDQAEVIKSELIDLLVAEDVRETVTVEFLQMGESRDPNTMMASEAKFVGKIETDDMDIVIMNQGMYERMTEPMALANLDDFLKESGIQIPEDYKIYATDSETGLEGVYALDVSMIPSMQKLVVDGENPHYLGVFAGTIRQGNVMKAIEYLLR